jgi:hypothetical protein
MSSTPPLDKDALLAHFQASRESLLGAIGGLTESEMVARSLDGWSVKDHLAHIALWDDVRASEVLRVSAGFESAWKMTAGEDEAFNAIGYQLRQDLSLRQVLWELETSRQRLLAAIRAAAPRAFDQSLYGESPIYSTHENQHAGWIRAWRDGPRA